MMIEIPLSLVYSFMVGGTVIFAAACWWTYWLGSQAQDPAKMHSAVQKGYDHGAKAAERAMDSCVGAAQANANAVHALNESLGSTIELAAITNVPAATERMHNHTVSCLTHSRMAESGGNGALTGGDAALPEEDKEHVAAGDM